MHLLIDIQTLNNDNTINGIWIIIGIASIYATIMMYKNYYLDKKREQIEDYESKIYHED